MSANIVVASTDIKIGEHVTGQFLGLTFNLDTIWTTAIAGLIVIGLGLWARSKATTGVPSKIQVFWEAIVEQVTTLVEGNLGRVNPYVVQLAIALFLFILISNWLELIPSGEDPHLLPAPTADVNLTYALAGLVIVGVHTHSVRERGVKAYGKHYLEPYPILFPLILIEEIVKPFTLALRLFGNIFSGAIMIALIGLLPLWSLWGPNAIWKLFDLFIGLIQAFIFALLTILYFGMAGESHGDGGHDTPPSKGSSEPSTAQPDSDRVPERVH